MAVVYLVLFCMYGIYLATGTHARIAVEALLVLQGPGRTLPNAPDDPAGLVVGHRGGSLAAPKIPKIARPSTLQHCTVAD